MDQKQLKEKLLKYTPLKDFTLLYSGKRSKKIDGIYHPDSKEIIINNKNFRDDSSLVYTGLHELAHHIDFTDNGPRKMAHSGDFPELLSNLVNKAIEGGDFTPIKHKVIDRAVRANRAYTEAMKDLGKALIDCIELCSSRDYPIEDVIHRELTMTDSEARAIMKTYTMDISPNVGGELAKKLTKIKNPEERHQAEKDQIIKKAKPPKTKGQDEFTRLRLEKEKVEKTLDKLHHKLEEIELQLEGYEHPDPPPLPEPPVPGLIRASEIKRFPFGGKRKKNGYGNQPTM